MYRRDPSGDDQSRPPAVTTDSTPGDIRPAGDLGALRRKRRLGQSKQQRAEKELVSFSCSAG